VAVITSPSHRVSQRRQFWEGARDQIPNLAGAIPFGLAAGAATAAVLTSIGATTLLHTSMFAGRGQMVAMQMLDSGAPLALIVLATLIVNLRNMMYGASIARHFGHLSWPWRLLLAFFLVDHVYAIAIRRLDHDAQTENAATRHWYYLGCGCMILTAWSISGVIGAVFGAAIPEQFGLSFVPNLSFIYILATSMRRPVDLLCGATAGLVACFLVGIPWQGGLFVGIVAGLVIGMLAGERA
jgi:predicted branched-subunit amino acid permease